MCIRDSDTLVVLRAHIRHLPLTCLYFRVADEQAFIVLLTAFAAYRVDENPKAYYFEQARNGVFARQAIITKALGLK